jgi:BirA family transcriptional regulator, biotin operon repressor / biotin---[acetyl-CoA-carboxylase] ligase
MSYQVVHRGPQPIIRQTAEGWAVHCVDEVSSTNDLCRALPEWNAVIATRQTAGRGRTGKSWVSDVGGLWMSLVIPADGPRSKWEPLPLTMGWTLLGVLRGLGVKDLRLRWPNDIMVGDRKLAGLLVERFSDTTAVIGLGVNISNQPDQSAPELAGQTVRLKDLLPHAPKADQLADAILVATRRMQEKMAANGFTAFVDEINAAWGSPRQVACELMDHTRQGTFCGIDQEGNLLMQDESGVKSTLRAIEVRIMKEL